MARRRSIAMIAAAAGLLAGEPLHGGGGCVWDCQTPADGIVDTSDFLALLSQWALVGAPCDFDGNGVDTVDFLDLLAHWGPCPFNDECTSAEVISRLGINDTLVLPLDLSIATPSLADSLCLGGGMNTHGDVWYCLQNDSGEDKVVHVSLDIPDLTIEITEGCVCPPGPLVACADSTTGASITLLAGEGVTIRVLDGNDLPPEQLDGNLVIANSPVIPVGACCIDLETCSDLTEDECATAGGAYQGDGTECASTDCGPCAAGVTVEENELDCGMPTDTTNGGCELATPVFTDINCFQTICGTVASTGAVRDTDWYRLTFNGPRRLTWNVTPTFPAIIGFVEYFPGFEGSGLCGDTTGFLTPVTNVPAFTEGSITTECMPGGQYFFFVAPQFGPVIECGAEYLAQAECVAGCGGACCLVGGGCLSNSPEVTCDFVGGWFAGEGVSCQLAGCFASCGSPGAGTCCAFNGTPGCDDLDCCNVVCGADPFCCNTSWDTICATQLVPMFPDECGECFP